MRSSERLRIDWSESESFLIFFMGRRDCRPRSKRARRGIREIDARGAIECRHACQRSSEKLFESMRDSDIAIPQIGNVSHRPLESPTKSARFPREWPR